MTFFFFLDSLELKEAIVLSGLVHLTILSLWRNLFLSMNMLRCRCFKKCRPKSLDSTIPDIFFIVRKVADKFFNKRGAMNKQFSLAAKPPCPIIGQP